MASSPFGAFPVGGSSGSSSEGGGAPVGGPLLGAPVRAPSGECACEGTSLRGDEAMIGVPVRTSGASSPTPVKVPVRTLAGSLQIAPVRALQEGHVRACEGGLSLEGACEGLRGMPVRILTEVLVKTSESACEDSPTSPVREVFERESGCGRFCWDSVVFAEGGGLAAKSDGLSDDVSDSERGNAVIFLETGSALTVVPASDDQREQFEMKFGVVEGENARELSGICGREKTGCAGVALTVDPASPGERGQYKVKFDGVEGGNSREFSERCGGGNAGGELTVDPASDMEEFATLKEILHGIGLDKGDLESLAREGVIAEDWQDILEDRPAVCLVGAPEAIVFSSAELPVPTGVACVLSHGKAPAPVAKSSLRLSASVAPQENGITRLVNNRPSEDVLCDVSSDALLCGEAMEVCLGELVCDEMEFNARLPCAEEQEPLLAALCAAEDETSVDDAVDAQSETIAFSTVLPRDALSYLFDGFWSVDTYEAWAVKYYNRPTAPYCDFKRYSKCVDLDVASNMDAQREAKICRTPAYKKKAKKVAATHISDCIGSEQDFEDLCDAFRTLSLPWVVIDGHGNRRKRSVLVRRLAVPQGVAVKPVAQCFGDTDGFFCGDRVKRKAVRRMAKLREARLWSFSLTEEESKLMTDRVLAKELRAESVRAWVDTQTWSAADVPLPKVVDVVVAVAASVGEREILSGSVVQTAGCAINEKAERNFMKTFGRRMQAKHFVENARGPVKALQDMNLGEKQHMSGYEKRLICCRNSKGEILQELYGDQESTRVALLFDDKPLVKARARKVIIDAGSEFNSFKRKCVVNAVLALASAEAREYMSGYFAEHCANDSGFGACGSDVEARNLKVVRRALRDCGSWVRVWGATSLRAFEKNDITSRGVLGCGNGVFLGDLVWCGEEEHVFVCSDLGDLEMDVFVCDVPWKQCVVGGPEDAELPSLAASSSDEGVLQDLAVVPSSDSDSESGCEQHWENFLDSQLVIPSYNDSVSDCRSCNNTCLDSQMCWPCAPEENQDQLGTRFASKAFACYENHECMYDDEANDEPAAFATPCGISGEESVGEESVGSAESKRCAATSNDLRADLSDLGKDVQSEGVAVPHKDTFRHTWWVRVDEFVRVAKLCDCAEDLARHVVFSDPLVAKWYQCMCQGLCARWAGNARVRAWRKSPGCGLNRRSARRELIGAVHRRDVFRAQQKAGSERSIGIFDVVGEVGERKLVSHGCSFAGCRFKCLQAAVVALLKDGCRDLARTEFKKYCKNNEPSGFGRFQRDARNLMVVERVLTKLSCFVWVFEAASTSLEDLQHALGAWRLGSGTGVCVGMMVWVESDAHVVAARVPSDFVPHVVNEPVYGCLCAPWFRYSVGAPKKKSQRGAHLKKNAEHYGSRWRDKGGSEVGAGSADQRDESQLVEQRGANLKKGSATHISKTRWKMEDEGGNDEHSRDHSQVRHEAAQSISDLPGSSTRNSDERLFVSDSGLQLGRVEPVLGQRGSQTLRGVGDDSADGDDARDDGSAALRGGVNVSSGLQNERQCSNTEVVRLRLRGVDDSSSSSDSPAARAAKKRTVMGEGDSSREDVIRDSSRISLKSGSHSAAVRLRGVDDSSSSDVPVVRAPKKRTLVGVDDSSSGDGKVVRRFGQQKRFRKRRGMSAGDVGFDSSFFQPKHVDVERCQALEWNHGHGKLQCSRKPKRGSDLCGHHLSRGAVHGRVRGPIPAKKLREFQARYFAKEKDSKQWYSRHMMWYYASRKVKDLNYLNELDARGEYRLSDADYERCLREIHDNMQANASRESKRYCLVRGVGVRTRDDRGDGSSMFGTHREQYNGEGGGRVFKWYTRVVFNSVLSRMGVDERSCSERQCMLALEITSAEISKFPIVRDRLQPFAGPQCFPHLDSSCPDYRVRANEEMSGGVDTVCKAASGKSSVVCPENWLRCQRPGCNKWRCVVPSAVSCLRGQTFNNVEASDIDWQSWLLAAPQRYEAIVDLQKMATQQDVGDSGEKLDGQDGNAPSIATGEACSANAMPSPSGRMRLRRKTGEPCTPVKMSPRGDVTGSPRTIGSPLTPRELLEVDPVAIPRTPDTPEFLEDGLKTPSDFELGSDDGIDLALSRVQESQKLGDGKNGEGDIGCWLRSKPNFISLMDVGTVKDKEITDIAADIHTFIRVHAGGGRKGFRIQREEACVVWEARQAIQRDLVSSVSDGSSLLRLGEALLAIVTRVCPVSAVFGHGAEALRDAASLFLKLSSAEGVYFECSMLQKMVEEKGEVKWKEVRCSEEDDFDALWNLHWPVGDVLRDDEFVVLPSARDNLTPECIGEMWELGRVGCGTCLQASAPNAKDQFALLLEFNSGSKGSEKAKTLEVHYERPCFSASALTEKPLPFEIIPQAQAVHKHRKRTRLDLRPEIKAGRLQLECRLFPLKMLPHRVAKYDVNLRKSGLRAVQAMHTILSRMVLFVCNDCNERFPTFHPAYQPPPSIAKDMEILKTGRSGVAACNVRVASWDEVPPLNMPDGLASVYSGTCAACRKDYDEQLRDQGEEQNCNIVGLRTAENHMDPCFRFPIDDFRDLFAGATITEAMLVALEHMQVNFVTVASSGLRKFRRNTLSFPQDVASFARRLQLMKNYRIGDRVNSVRGLGADPSDPERAVRKAINASQEERARYSVDSSGFLVFPARVVEVRGHLLVLEYQHGGEGIEKSENVTPRLTMPWHPRDVPLHIMLRRNIGRGRDAIEGLTVRWWYVANLLQALCAFPRNGDGPWRLGGCAEEPMHKYYDPGMFHMITDPEELKREFAPVELDGVVLSADEKQQLSAEDQVEHAINVESIEGLMAAGFDVNFVGPVDEKVLLVSDQPSLLVEAETGGQPQEEFVVDEDTFRMWLSSPEFPLGYAVQRWWTGVPASADGAVEGVKADDDETEIDFFQRICADEYLDCKDAGGKSKREHAIGLRALVRHLKAYIGSAFDDGMPDEVLEDEVMLELSVVLREKDCGTGDNDRGCVKEVVDDVDAEEDALRTAERLVYGWPSKDEDPTGARSVGRFVKSFPLEFPMGIGDLYEDRPRQVSPEVWVQHLLRYRTGQFVSGMRGQRLLWAMVNTLLLSEARARGFGIYRNVIRRVGFGLEGGGVMTKGRLREILRQEDRLRVLVSQLANVGRDVRSTTMQWSYESKKLDATVKHLSWVPPWVYRTADEDKPAGHRYLGGSGAVEDMIGLGRHPSQWWTMNCKYNAAYDVQRLNSQCDLGAGVLSEMDSGGKRERFLFVRENPDLVAFILALRTELLMRVVMPAVVRHNSTWPYMSMARFETGPTGNPHYHGFSVGLPGPQMKRVHDDLGEDFDMPLETVDEDLAEFLAWFEAHSNDESFLLQADLAEAELLDMIRSALGEQELERESDEEGLSLVDDFGENLFAGRVRDVVEGLVRHGLVERRAGVGEDVRYIFLGKKPEASGKKRGPRLMSTARILEAELDDVSIMKPENEEVSDRSALERAFYAFFNDIVSEWNPCFSDDGHWRYKWEDLYDIDEGTELTAESRARQEIPGREPERMNLRAVLDKVLKSVGEHEPEVVDAGEHQPKVVDVQGIRRLVAGLVNRVARHTKHGHQPPRLGVHACARGKESCPYCRYGFPHKRLRRDCQRNMILERGDREGQWHGRFPRNEGLVCSYEPHILLANMGNIDWRPVLNLWAVVQYVTKYATKAPKGSRKLQEVLKDAVDEVCKYVPDDGKSDFLKRSIQKFFARTLGERDFHVYEAVQLGMQLPLVIPLMPIVTLNTTGARALKPASKKMGEDEPVHHDSKVDKFNKRLQIVRHQLAQGFDEIKEAEIRDVSLYEFYWKYVVEYGRIKRATRPVCLMVTPSYSADCANVEHACHESYARAAVIAYWRHMATKERHEMFEKSVAVAKVQPVSHICLGASNFEHPPRSAVAPATDRYLGIRDLFAKFEGARDYRGGEEGWGLALMEMMIDPVLYQWVPAWVAEQYERANPFFKEVLVAAIRQHASTQRVFLKRVKREMVRRHHLHLKRKEDAGTLTRDFESEREGDSDDSNAENADNEEDLNSDLAQRLVNEGDDDPNAERIEIDREARPQAGVQEDSVNEGLSWEARTAVEQLSAAGAARQAPDQCLTAIGCENSDGQRGMQRFGTLFNPRDYPWASLPCNVNCREAGRIEQLRDAWYGKAFVGDGAEVVERNQLDPWQKFAFDVVMDSRHSFVNPLRLFLLGTAGTGKSRTVRSFVHARRLRTRRAYEQELFRAKLAFEQRQQHASQQVSSRSGTERPVAQDILTRLGVSREEAAAFLNASDSTQLQSKTSEKGNGKSRGRGKSKSAQRYASVREKVDEHVRNSCLLAAPTGCASFQLRFGASTLHRVFGVPVGFCGKCANRNDGRFLKMRTRLTQARLFVFDEMSMVGRQMLGKVEFKVRDCLREAARDDGDEIFLGGRDTVFAGDPKQANPIGDEPLYKEGDYSGKGVNKPRGSDRTPSDAWSTHKLVRMGMAARNTFRDTIILREVHRLVSERPDLTLEQQSAFRRDAVKFLEVTRGMADCTWSREDYTWLQRRNRRFLQQTPEGRAELQKFADAPLLMDGRKDRVTGEVGANTINLLKLENLSAATGKPILVLRAFHDKPKTDDGAKMKPQDFHEDDFRGMVNEIMVCEGARVLLTQNLWVEAGLMNGALGYVRGYMLPDGFDPHSEDPALRAPLCVFVEFDSVDMRDEHGQSRSFFPDDPPADVPGSRRNWVPIFRQRVSSTVEEHVWRENYPLQLAWALTHWKAQGMTLDRVRVHLSDRTAGVAGVAFVACTRVRHPWDMVFEEDLPDYEHFMKARRTPAFRERKRFELRQEANASRTLRKFGYCEADLWSAAEASMADEILSALLVTAREQRDRLKHGVGNLDSDTWLWGDSEPDFVAEVMREAARLGGDDVSRKNSYAHVARRLLDHVRVRVANADEARIASELLEGGGFESGGFWSASSLDDLRNRGREVCEQDASKNLDEYMTVARMIAKRYDCIGAWDGKIIDEVPQEWKPLHMSAVREALGALIPEKLHRNLDKAVQRQKDNFGELRGGNTLSMEGWRVSVRAEDALATGRLTEDVLELFLKIANRVCKELNLPLAIGSKTVGREVGRQEKSTQLANIMEHWKAVWQGAEVRSRETLIIPVAVDDRQVPQDWLCVCVRSAVRGQRLGDAEKLVVGIHDSTMRASVARRLAQNLDVLVRGVGAGAVNSGPSVEFLETPNCNVKSQQVLVALGLLFGYVGRAAGTQTLSPSSEAFVPDVSHVLRALFVYLRTELGERGYRSAEKLLEGADACRTVLRMLGCRPSLRSSHENLVAKKAGVGCGRRLEAEKRMQQTRPLRIATWNIAGGHTSARAPRSYNADDQRSAIVREIRRWQASFGCDILALQECEGADALAELNESFAFVASVEASALRGFVHLYVRKGMDFELFGRGASTDACVGARVALEDGTWLTIVAVHLPVGDKAGLRERILQEICKNVGSDGDRLLVVGDMNAKDDEIQNSCKKLGLQEARYAGYSWGVKHNRFYQDMVYAGPGLRKDRVLFGKQIWAETHLIGQARIFFEGADFFLSDHFGVMAYVDTANVYASKATQDVAAARARRRQLLELRDGMQQRELAEVKAMDQQGREEQVHARQRKADHDRADYTRAQRRGAKWRRERRASLRQAAFGEESLFAEHVVSTPARSVSVPCAPRDVEIGGFGNLGRSSWDTTKDVPLRGMTRAIGDNICYVISVAQVLLRIPAVLRWVIRHNEDGCPGDGSFCVLCSLYRTYRQLLDGSSDQRNTLLHLAENRELVQASFRGNDQQDVVEFFDNFCQRLRELEIQCERFGLWGHVEIDRAVVTHADRLFSFVLETRRRCKVCRHETRSWFSAERVLRLDAFSAQGGAMTVSDMYLKFCEVKEEELRCERCRVDKAIHECQTRIASAPNVLAVQIKRGNEARVEVSVDDVLDLPALDSMVVVGVIYHTGVTTQTGHYTCVCRGPGGGFWYYDDAKPVRRIYEEISHVKPRQVYMVMYARRDGGALWPGAVDDVMEVAAARDACADGSSEIPGVMGAMVVEAVPEALHVMFTPRRLRRKTSLGASSETSLMPMTPSRRFREKTAMLVASPKASSSGIEKRDGDEVVVLDTQMDPLLRLSLPGEERRMTFAEDASSGHGVGRQIAADGDCRRQEIFEEASRGGDADRDKQSLARTPRRLREKTPPTIASPYYVSPLPVLREDRGVSAEGLRVRGDLADDVLPQNDVYSPSRRVRHKSHPGALSPVSRGVVVGASARAFSSVPQSSSTSLLKRRRRTEEDVTAPKAQPETARRIIGGCVETVAHGWRADSELRRPRVASLFSDDVMGDAARCDAAAYDRARNRVQEGVRGRVRDMNNDDVDRSSGGAFHI